MNIYLIILILILIFLKDFYIIYDHENLSNIKTYGLKLNSNYLKKYNIAVYNSNSNINKIHILSKYIPLDIHLFNEKIEFEDIYDLFIIRENEKNSDKNIYFVSGFDYEYLFLITKLNLKSISNINKNNKYKFGSTKYNRKILETLLKIIELNNYEIIVYDEPNMFENFQKDNIDFLFHICDEKNKYFKNISINTTFNILNLDINYDILSTLFSMYKKTLPINIFNKELSYNTIDTFALRNIIVTTNKNNEKLINIILEIFFYYNKKIRDEYQFSTNDYKFATEFLNKNHLSFNFNLKYHPTSLEYFKKKKYIIQKTI